MQIYFPLDLVFTNLTKNQMHLNDWKGDLKFKEKVFYWFNQGIPNFIGSKS